MRYGYWLPVFGGWLRNVEDEQMAATWEYTSRLARRSEEIGFDLTLIAELNLNDIKGADAPALDAWSTAAALAAVTKRLELMVAVRPTFHLPAILAKQAANIDHIAGPGRLSLNVVSSWWADEAKKYGVHFERHDDRYARTAEWLEIVDQLWKRDHFSFSGSYYQIEDSILRPKPISQPRPLIYAGGESEAAKELISERCDAFVMHGDPPDRIRSKIADMSERREKKGLGPMSFGVAAYSVVRDTEEEAQRELARITDVKQSAAGYDNYQHSNGWPGQSLINMFPSKITPLVIEDCDPDLSAHPAKLRNALPSLKRLALTFSCCNAAPSLKRWSVLLNR
jgi:dimethylsulfone monooxygenase